MITLVGGKRASMAMGLEMDDGWDFLGGAKILAAAQSAGTVQVPPRDLIKVFCHINALTSGSEIPGLRFNGDTTLANYISRWIAFSTAAVVSSVVTTGQSLARLTGVATSLEVLAEVTIGNQLTRKLLSMTNAKETASVATAVPIEIGWAEYLSTASLISQIELRCCSAGGIAIMNAGSGFAVFGKRTGGG